MFTTARRRVKQIIADQKLDEDSAFKLDIEGNATPPLPSAYKSHHFTALPESYTLSQLHNEIVHNNTSSKKEVTSELWQGEWALINF
jgi:hypothetical protein